MTVMITLERYLIIAFPARSRTWFTPKNAKFMIAAIYICTTVFLAFPRYSSIKIVPNDFGSNIPSLKSWSYLMMTTPLYQFWYHTMGAYFVKVDFWVPLPTLLFLNFLIYLEVRKFARKRREMNMKQEREIRAARMFVPIVGVLFLCNIEPFMYQYFIVKDKVAYRDMAIGIFLSVAVNSSVNMPIYYLKGSNFRNEVKELFMSSKKRLLSLKFWGNNEFRTSCEQSTGVLDVSSRQSGNSSSSNK